VGSSRIGSAQRHCESGLLRVGSRSWWAPSRHIRWRRAVGLAVIHPSFEPALAWLAFLHVSRPYRRRGAAKSLWDAAVDISIARSAERIYVSAAPTESAVAFYQSQGCRLADPVHPELFAAEPEDIHFVRALP
jgi:ribosomal protein S18 acetylase RimI-like enzyme